jgi:1-deoxy-D-xylulose-5-phosphate synthase
MPVVTIEEHALAGGFGSHIIETISDMGATLPVLRLGIKDSFIEHGTQKELREIAGLGSENIFNRVSNWIGKTKKLKLAV